MLHGRKRCRLFFQFFSTENKQFVMIYGAITGIFSLFIVLFFSLAWQDSEHQTAVKLSHQIMTNLGAVPFTPRYCTSTEKRISPRQERRIETKRVETLGGGAVATTWVVFARELTWNKYPLTNVFDCEDYAAALRLNYLFGRFLFTKYFLGKFAAWVPFQLLRFWRGLHMVQLCCAPTPSGGLVVPTLPLWRRWTRHVGGGPGGAGLRTLWLVWWATFLSISWFWLPRFAAAVVSLWAPSSSTFLPPRHTVIKNVGSHLNSSVELRTCKPAGAVVWQY